jgi:translocator assembly and maintenance protein 41
MLNQVVSDNFPQQGVSLSFGYGSRVIKQDGNLNGGDLVDVIIAVDNPLQWHQENLSRNNHHYSLLKRLPQAAEQIVRIQEDYGAGVYFNPYVTIGSLSIKYGVIKTDHLIRDLLDWTDLYVAGRLHKPVEFIVNTCDRNERLRSALRFNKESAIRAALLQLPESFETSQFYKTITNLSYNGDPRMWFGEDKNKINNIVSKQMDRFDQLYLPIIKMSPAFRDSVHLSESKRLITQDCSPSVILKNLKLLPKNVKRRICSSYGREARTSECDVVLASLSRNIDCDKKVTRVLASIVLKSSSIQSMKGLLTAGLLKSLRYSHRKLVKSFVSRCGWSA